jgi:ferritin
LNKLVGASIWEEELYDHLTSHEQKEREMLVKYQEAAAASHSAAFAYLASLIVDDEIQHHKIFRDLASALKSDAELRPEEPVIPRLDVGRSDPKQVLELTEQLLQSERADAKELHRLAREMKDVKDTTMWGLLVKLMEMDTAKHIEILEFARHQARRSSGG